MDWKSGMNVKGIKLSEVMESLELLKRLCLIHETCDQCWLYDSEIKACLLNKTKMEAFSIISAEAQRYINQQQGCISPECPYCPSCEYGFVSYPEDTMPGDENSETEWHCLHDPEVGGGEEKK